MKQIFFALILAFIFSFSAVAQNQNSSCAKIEISGGGVLEAETPMTFTVEVSGMTKSMLLEYEWKVSNGTIAGGQGTPTVMIDTTGLADKTEIKAEIKIKGLYDNCPNTASESGSVKVITAGCGRPNDAFGKLPNNEIRARIDALFIGLSNEMNAQLYIINYGTEEEIAAREKLIAKHVAFKKYTASRMTLVRGGENPYGETGAYTKAWLVPPGAQQPTP